MSKQPNVIIVTGGVCSSLGKGIATASIGAILKSCNKQIFVQKLDPYLNVDPGTMNPSQHGEVFVTDDGAETDLDLGHYERFIDEPMNKLSTMTTGKIYSEVIAKERKGDFLGGTIQVIPHITDAIKHGIMNAATTSKCDIMMVEVGGTVGDIEAEPYLEAIRQLRTDIGNNRFCHIHLTLLPYLRGSQELKTKPTQLSVRELRRIGLHPDMILARADEEIPSSLLDKISKFCGVPRESVIPAPTLSSIYDVPLNLYNSNVATIIGNQFGLSLTPNMQKWIDGTKRHQTASSMHNIAIVGKYMELEDSYISIVEAVKAAAIHEGKKVHITWVDSECLDINNDNWSKQSYINALHSLQECKGIIIAGGFGSRGVEGKILAAKYARMNNIPFLGICLGCQVLAIEYARHVLKDPEITSEELNPSNPDKHIIHFLPDQNNNKDKGGTLRLGKYECVLYEGSKARELYGADRIWERHRHRYEFNNEYRHALIENGMNIAGEYVAGDTKLVEILELEDHPFMIGVQFHPEFKSRPHRPHPLFVGFVKAGVSISAHDAIAPRNEGESVENMSISPQKHNMMSIMQDMSYFPHV